MYFSILNGDKIKITHNIAPINLHSSINITAMSRCVNVCPILTNPDTYVNLFLETSLQWGTVLFNETTYAFLRWTRLLIS